jgi:hypothetical protein
MTMAISSPSYTPGPSGAPQKGTAVTPTSWTPAGEMDRREWQLEGRRLGAISKASPWWVGDWLAFGTEQWGDRYTEARALTGYDVKTLRNLRYVSTSVAKDVRVPDLTWSHHCLVAGLKDREEQEHWLKRAVSERLAVEDLRIELRTSERGRYRTRETPKPSTEETPRVVICPRCGGQVAVPAYPIRTLGAGTGQPPAQAAGEPATASSPRRNATQAQS